MGCVQPKPNSSVSMKIHKSQSQSFRMQKTMSASQNQIKQNSFQKNSDKKNTSEQAVASQTSSAQSIYSESADKSKGSSNSKNNDIENNQVIISFSGKGNLDKNHKNNFDDFGLLREKNTESQKITAIKISYTDDFIEGFQIAYEASNGSIIPGNHNSIFLNPTKTEKNSFKSELKNKQSNSEKDSGSKNQNCYQLQEDVFEIPVDDYLVQIVGRKGEFLNQIQFITQKGEVSNAFGNSSIGKPFIVNQSGKTFGAIGAKFTNKNLIHQLKFDLNPIPLDINSLSDFSDPKYQ